MSRKTTTGANDRSRETTIAQTGPGIPDDTGAKAVIENENERAKDNREDPQRRLKKEVADEIEASKRGAE